MTQTVLFTRRRFLTMSAAAIAASVLAACSGGTTMPTNPSPTESPTLPSAPALPTAPAATPVSTSAPTAIPPTRVPTIAFTPPTMIPTAPVPKATPAASTIAKGTTPSGVYNVKQYGATGDGVTDDTAAIQAAINAVPSSGGTVLFPPGTYIVAPTKQGGIAIKSNVRIAGSGANTTLKIKDRTGDWFWLFAPKTVETPVSNVTFEDLSFDSNIVNNPGAMISGKNEQTYQIFIYITTGSKINIRRCRFAPCSGVWAISLNGTITTCSVTDCYFQFVMRDSNPDYDNSMVYIEASDYTLSGNRFETPIIPNRGGRGCMESHGGPAQVFNNTSAGFQTGLNITGSGIKGGSTGDIICRDNTFTDALLGIMMWPTAPTTLNNVLVTNNTIQVAQITHGMVPSSGIETHFAYEATTLGSNLTISNNTITFQDEGGGRPGDFAYNSFGIGLHSLGGVNGCLIDGNTINFAPAAGIQIGLPEPGDRSFANIKVTNNQIINPGQNLGFIAGYRVGVGVASAVSDLTISGNTIRDTFPQTRCAAAIAFDQSTPHGFRRIQIVNNTIESFGTLLPSLIPAGIEN